MNSARARLEHPSASSAPAAGPGALRRVLLVDPSVHVLHVMKSSLDRHGYEVDTALSSDFALALHREHGHAVVVVDGDAFGRAGAALVDGLRRGAGASSLVVVMGGGTARGDDGGAGRAAGIERWAKPVSLRYLVARLTEHFGRFGRELGTRGPSLGAVGAPATRG